MPTTFHGFGFDTIYVLESLPVGHMRTGRDLHGDVLVPLVYGTGVRVEFHVIESAADLTVRLDAIREPCLREHRGPIIHLEAHGDPAGVELRNGEFLPWSEFARQMGEINLACGLNLFFVMAACEGGNLASVLDVTDVHTPGEYLARA